MQSSVTAIIPCKLKTYPRKELPPGSWGKEGRSVGGGEADLLHDVFELGCAPFITPLEVGPGLEQHWDCHPFPARACVRAVVAHTVVPGGDSALQALPCWLLPRGTARKARFARCSGATYLYIFALVSRSCRRASQGLHNLQCHAACARGEGGARRVLVGPAARQELARSPCS